MLDAIRYLVDNGIKWRSMPSDFPPWPRCARTCAARLHASRSRSCRRAGTTCPATLWTPGASWL
ncbi:hypothetical protein [Streptomyces sp. NPDC048737]